ncbi:hypothetical protein [Candidatus Sororendozoicomonas aggregata]|uniref:hypothetical protein n=1 Tax=Candidatus Sororendozoicomonas aggregata TaxID=3073239 RepID=UPI002ED12653
MSEVQLLAPLLAGANTRERTLPMPFQSPQKAAICEPGSVSTGSHKLSMAHAALRFANAHTPLGCSNQGVGHLDAIHPWTPDLPDSKKAEKIILKSRKKRKNYFFQERVVEIAKSQAGNCGEKSALVCFFLSQQPNRPIYYRVSLWPADHTFVVINQRPSKEGLFPDNFNDWNDDAVIIDPWVGICGPARHYPELWRMKLDGMAEVGVELSNGYGLIKRNWLKANAELWQTMPDRNRKYVANKCPLPTPKCCIL